MAAPIDHLQVLPLGGMVERHVQPSGAADLIVDMTWDDEGCWREAGGYATIRAGTGWGSVGAFHTLHWFEQHGGGRRWLIGELVDPGGFLVLFAHNPQSTGNPWSLVAAPGELGRRALLEQPWPGTQYVNHGNWCYVLNGIDEPIRWNGREVLRVGFSRAPGPPQAEFLEQIDILAEFRGFGGANSYDARGVGPWVNDEASDPVVRAEWTFGYAYAWVNDLGHESPLSPLTFVSGVNTNEDSTGGDYQTNGKRHVLVKIPRAPIHVRGVRLYRTENLAELQGLAPDTLRHQAVYLHTEIASGYGVTLVDGCPDSELGRKHDPDSVGLYPTGARFMAIFQGVAFYAGMPEAPATLRHSAPVFLEQVPEINAFTMPAAITGLFASREALVVFTARGVHLVRGNAVSGFYLSTLDGQAGCTAPNAVVEVAGLGVLFLGADGPYLLTGTLGDGPAEAPRILRIDALTRTWRRRVNTGALARARVAHLPKDREVWFTVPADGNSWPTLGIVLHYGLNVWSLREDWPMRAVAVTTDHRQQLYFAGGTIGGGIYAYGHGYALKGATAKVARYRSGWMHFGNPWRRTQLEDLSLLAVATGARSLTFQLWQDNRDDPIELTATGGTRVAEDSEFGRPRWGTAVWGPVAGLTTVWADYQPTQIPFTAARRPFTFRWEVTASRVRIIGADYRVVSEGSDFAKGQQGLGGGTR